jgi:hypothetical protein
VTASFDGSRSPRRAVAIEELGANGAVAERDDPSAGGRRAGGVKADVTPLEREDGVFLAERDEHRAKDAVEERRVETEAAGVSGDRRR